MKQVRFEPSEFFLLRTPCFPVDELLAWSDGLSLAAGSGELGGAQVREFWDRDSYLLRSRLAEILTKPAFLQAIYLASPSLSSSLRYWKEDPSSKKGVQVERALVRYFQRMCSRPTPFGVFAGTSIGTISATDVSTHLQLSSIGSYQCATRLDYGVLATVVDSLLREPEIANACLYYANSSLRRRGDSWHYVEIIKGEKHYQHRLVSAQADEYLDYAIHLARAQAKTVRELVDGMAYRLNDPEVDAESLTEYVHDLIGSGVLLSTLEPLVTGDNALEDIMRQLETLPIDDTRHKALSCARDTLSALNNSPLGVPPAAYLFIEEALKPLLGSGEVKSTVQVDLFKPAVNLVIGRDVREAMIEAVRVCARLGVAAEHFELRRFREDFVARYDQACIPLSLALDEDEGIGFGNAVGLEGGSLVKGLDLGLGKTHVPGREFSNFHGKLLQKIVEGQIEGDTLELSPDELPLGVEAAERLPHSFCVSAVLSSESPRALAAGNFEILYKGGSGPSAGRMLGRFCYADRRLSSDVADLLKREAETDPDAIFVEVVYMPEGRLGNVVSRPILRDYEFVYLGRSGAPKERQLTLDDLYVAVRGDAIILYSARLKRRIIPRLASAHSFTNHGLPSLYRFLGLLQQQACYNNPVPSFDWGPLAVLSYLPRVRVGKVILSLAQWRITAEEIKSLAGSDRVNVFIKMQELRRARKLPRWVVMPEGDNHLQTDLDNPLSVDAFIHTLGRVKTALLLERYPDPASLCVRGAEGLFEHELMVPFFRGKDDAETVPVLTNDIAQFVDAHEADAFRVKRSFPPASEWSYIKIYAGLGFLDVFVKTILPKLLSDLRVLSESLEWFFIRYADPAPHLRLRVKMDLAQLSAGVLEALQPHVSSGRVWKLQCDTYERELERYGGLEGVASAERIFRADSDAVVKIISHLKEEDSDARWKAALLGMQALLEDSGLSRDQRATLILQQRDSLAKSLGLSPHGRGQLANRFRESRAELRALVRHSAGTSVDSAIRQILDERSVSVRAEFSELRILESKGELTSSVENVASSVVHMHVNRMMNSSQQSHELALYYFLARLYHGELHNSQNATSIPLRALNASRMEEAWE